MVLCIHFQIKDNEKEYYKICAPTHSCFRLCIIKILNDKSLMNSKKIDNNNNRMELQNRQIDDPDAQSVVTATTTSSSAASEATAPEIPQVTAPEINI